MIEKLIQATSLVATALVLYGTWLLWPEKLPIMLLGFLILYIFGMTMNAAPELRQRLLRHVS
jgi:hypothetical protein